MLISAFRSPLQTPPTLKLGSEMEPFRQSLPTLKPGLFAEALGEAGHKPDDCDPGMLRRSLARSVAAAVASNPPTPRFGGPANAEDTWRHRHAVVEMQREDSFESLAGEVSDGGDTPEPPRRPPPRRKPQQRAQPQPSTGSKQDREVTLPQKQAVGASVGAHGDVVAALRHMDEAGFHAAVLQALAAQQEAKGIKPPAPAGKPAAHLRTVAEKFQAAEFQVAPPVKTTQVSVAQLLGGDGEGRAVRGRSASMSPVRASGRQQTGSAQPRGIPAVPRAAVQSAPVSPAKGSAAPRRQQAAQPRGRTMQRQASLRPTAASAPVSRATSPMKEPSIQPRMTKAAAARSEATQRLLNSRRQRELKQWSSISEAVRQGKAKVGIHDAGARGVSTQGAQKGVGFALPPAGYGALPAGQSEAHSVEPCPLPVALQQEGGAPQEQYPSCSSSPRYADMLDRLAMGMSVDLDLVQAAKQPKALPVKLSVDARVPGDQPGDLPSARSSSNSSGFGAAVRAVNLRGNGGVEEGSRVYAGPAATASDSPPLASQKMVSIHDVARSMGSSRGSSEEMVGADGGEEEVVAVDASSNTLLQQLLGMQRSLSLQDLEALRGAIRREANGPM